MFLGVGFREGYPRADGFTIFTVSAIFTLPMKKGEAMKMKPMPPRALQIVRQIPNLSVAPRRGCRYDLLIEGEGRQPILLEYKRYLGPAQAWEIVRRFAEPGVGHGLVVAEEATARARDILREHKLGFIDAKGAAYIKLPGLLIHTEGQTQAGRNGKAARRGVRFTSKAGAAVQALLLEPRRRWRVQELAKIAGVSLGLAYQVMRRLEREGAVRAEGKGPNTLRIIVDPGAILDVWAEEDATRAVQMVRAHKLARSPRDLMETVGVGLDRAGIRYAFTGAAAASLVAPFLTAVPVAELWISSAVPAREAALGASAEEVPDGNNLVIRQAADDSPLVFARKEQGICLANNFRIYRDLLDDPRRGREQAKHLREEVIGW